MIMLGCVTCATTSNDEEFINKITNYLTALINTG